MLIAVLDSRNRNNVDVIQGLLLHSYRCRNQGIEQLVVGSVVKAGTAVEQVAHTARVVEPHIVALVFPVVE